MQHEILIQLFLHFDSFIQKYSVFNLKYCDNRILLFKFKSKEKKEGKEKRKKMRENKRERKKQIKQLAGRRFDQSIT